MTLASTHASMPLRTARPGGWSLPKVAALAIATLPMLRLTWLTVTNEFGPPSLDWMIHFTGSWALRMTLLALAITPARRIFNAPRLIAMRRTLGVAAFAYALVHVASRPGSSRRLRAPLRR
jgi:methionine sulfoxide reductase heme-binding subunit